MGFEQGFDGKMIKFILDMSLQIREIGNRNAFYCDDSFRENLLINFTFFIAKQDLNV